MVQPFGSNTVSLLVNVTSNLGSNLHSIDLACITTLCRALLILRSSQTDFILNKSFNTKQGKYYMNKHEKMFEPLVLKLI